MPITNLFINSTVFFTSSLGTVFGKYNVLCCTTPLSVITIDNILLSSSGTTSTFLSLFSLEAPPSTTAV